MSKRSRIFLGILLAYMLGVAGLIYRQLEDIDPRYRESAEESLVETAQLMASWVEAQSRDGTLRTEALKPLFDAVYARRFTATIFEFQKTQVELRMLVVDTTGRVVFDSTGRHQGEDFSRWRDIRLALQGDYGARTSADLDGDNQSSVMYVAAPIRHGDTVLGAVSLGKPTQSLGQFVEAARRKTLQVGGIAVMAVLVLVLMLSIWLVTRPIGLLADFWKQVRAQPSLSMSQLVRQALRTLRAAYDDLRDTLAGRNHVADYVQTLTHEVKSPLSAIRGAAELLQEPMPDEDRARFAANIARETQRIQELVDRMMELTVLESRHHLREPAPVPLRPLLEEMVQRFQASGAPRGVRVQVVATATTATVHGDVFLLRRALSNLIDNALDFSPEGGQVSLSLQVYKRQAEITVRDHGPGIPEYAGEKVFEKFYSLARPHSNKRSTGLGLSFVKEIAALHRGTASLRNAPDGGALATLSLPLLDGPHAV